MLPCWQKRPQNLKLGSKICMSDQTEPRVIAMDSRVEKTRAEKTRPVNASLSAGASLKSMKTEKRGTTDSTGLVKQAMSR